MYLSGMIESVQYTHPGDQKKMNQQLTQIENFFLILLPSIYEVGNRNKHLWEKNMD